jgi:UDP-3-O-[3-hydroxymyristoyl] glucosamine N-acyltransferase
LTTTTPYRSFAQALHLFYPDALHSKAAASAADASTLVHPTAWIGNRVVLEPGAVIGREATIGDGTTIADNLVQIAHNVVIGRHCVIVAQSGIAGSAQLGDFVVMGAHSGVIGHVTVGSGAQIAGAAHVKGDVEAGARMGGTPARRFKEWARELAALKQLGRRVRRLGG